MRPKFLLSAGRKSCALAHPLAPRKIETDDVTEAFRTHFFDAKLPKNNRPSQFSKTAKAKPQDPGGEVALEDGALDEGATMGDNFQGRRRRRLDAPDNRRKWHFSARWELVFAMEPKELPDEPKAQSDGREGQSSGRRR